MDNQRQLRNVLGHSNIASRIFQILFFRKKKKKVWNTRLRRLSDLKNTFKGRISSHNNDGHKSNKSSCI